MAHVPIACTLSDEALTARRTGLLAEVVALSTKRTKLPAGYRLEFSANSDALMRIAAMIEAERQCCQFLRFELTVESNRGAIALDLTGPEGTREFLASLLEPA